MRDGQQGQRLESAQGDRVMDRTARRRLLFAACLTSLSVAAWELCLTRLASVLFFHELAYAVIAVGLVAIAAGAAWTGRWMRRDRPMEPALRRLLLWLPTSTALTTVALLQGNLAWGIGLFALPFGLFGAITTLMYRLCRDRSPWQVYGVELGGAVVGFALFGPLLIGSVGASVGALIAAAIALPAAGAMLWRAGQRPLRWPTLAALVPVGLLCIALVATPTWLATPVIGDVGVQTHLERVVAREGRVSLTTRWSAWARTDFLRTRADDAAYAFTDAMFVARSARWDGSANRFDSQRLQRLAALQRLPWSAGRVDEVLVLGAGAGFGVAIALQEGSGQVHAVEVNGDTVAFARRLGHENGRVYSRPEVEVHVAEGRRFMSRDRGQYDLISLALVETSPAVLRGRSHVHARLLTVQAVEQYLQHLAPGGAVAIVHNAPDLARRSVATALAAMGRSQDAGLARLAAFHLPDVVPAENPFSHLLMIADKPWSEAQLTGLAAAAKRLGACVDWLPGGAATTPSWMADGGAPRADLPPPTDEQPFFFTRRAGMPLHGWLGVLALVFALGMAWRTGRGTRAGERRRLAAALVCSGAAAALVQVAAVYRMQTAVGAPSVAMGAAIGALLAGAGVAAMAWSRIPSWCRQPFSACLLASASSGLLWLLSATWAEALARTSPATATIAAMAALALHGLPLGLPFVALLQATAHDSVDGEAMAVAQDAFGAVIGATAATVVAVLAGYGWVFAAAALLLLGAGLVVRRTRLD